MSACLSVRKFERSGECSPFRAEQKAYLSLSGAFYFGIPSALSHGVRAGGQHGQPSARSSKSNSVGTIWIDTDMS